MQARIFAATAAAMIAFSTGAIAQAPPPFSTTKVEGTDNVYIYRYMGHQAIFIVTKAGVIATDPIGRYRPQAVTTYIDEIKKVTNQPVKYVIYSHSHYDHIAGGKPFKDAGAKFVAHKNAKSRFLALQKSKSLLDSVVIPDEVVDNKRVITLGGTTLELLYVGRNHSDSTLVMRLPKEKLIFAVDFIPIQGLQFRNMPDNVSPLEYQDSLRKVLALDWERMIPGHPGPGGRLGTKKDVEDHLGYMEELSAEVKKAADAGKCTDTAQKEIKLPKYEKWSNYELYLPMNIERYCYWWSQGY
ncbi:MAG TPA: MBL fold metallo-hydrolase [Xanthobacteraceae bacterium]|nr:MBL fold metallo-hydrolase [Xanthobacteraceae bacterium]